jgi:fibronectin type 3 domain-containing protein
MKKSIFLFLSLLFSQLTFAQQGDSLGVMAQVGTTSVMLKWLPSSYDLWMLGSRLGYNIQRTEVQLKDGKWKTVSTVALNTEAIKPWSDERIAKEAETNPDFNNAKVLTAGRVFQDNLPAKPSSAGGAEVQMQKDYLHVMSLLANLLKNKSSEAMGLFYEDKTVQPGKIYLYQVLLNSSKQQVEASAVANMTAPTQQPNILGFDFKVINKSVELYWLQPKYSGYFAYDVYRSASKGGEYKKVNKDPYIGELGITLDEKRMKYIDSFPEMNKTYYYKIKAVNGFEKSSAFSEVVTVKAVTFLQFAPMITKASSKDNLRIDLEWEVTAVDKENIMSFSVWTAKTQNDVMKKLNDKPLSPKIYTYTDARLNKPTFNYYKVCAYGFTGDSTCSILKDGFLVDSFPPAKPITVSGICDTNGVVTLIWKKNKEEDIYGYRIFRTFYKHKEPKRITDSTYKDTMYIDKVDVRAGWRKIYYAIVAIDEVFNASLQSTYIEVLLPDNVPPMNAVFKDFKTNYSGITLMWQPSTSEDVKYQYLYKKSEFEFQWNPFLTLSGDDLKRSSIRDTTTQTDVWYEYKLVAEDSSGLRSPEEQILRVQQPEKDPFPRVVNVKAIASRPNKMIKLTWDFNKQADGFKIMRSQNGKPVETYEFVKGSKREFYDTWLTTNTEYSYAIIAELPDGRESVLSVVIKVTY